MSTGSKFCTVMTAVINPQDAEFSTDRYNAHLQAKQWVVKDIVGHSSKRASRTVSRTTVTDDISISCTEFTNDPTLSASERRGDENAR